MSGQKTNIQLLTEGQTYIQRAKKARRDQVEEIKFDDEARRDWLTGFSKRKKAKTDERRARAKEREKQEHLASRRKARQELRERAAENVKSVRAAMGLEPPSGEEQSGDEDEGSGSEAGPSKLKDLRGEAEEVEFSDEDQLATVVITEDFDPTVPSSFTRESSTTPQPEDQDLGAAESTKTKVIPVMPASSHRAQSKAKKENDRAKEKKRVEKERSRSMETRAERKKGKAMEAFRRTKRAGIAMERDGKKRGKGDKGRKGAPRGKPRK